MHLSALGYSLLCRCSQALKLPSYSHLIRLLKLSALDPTLKLNA